MTSPLLAGVEIAAGRMRRTAAQPAPPFNADIHTAVEDHPTQLASLITDCYLE